MGRASVTGPGYSDRPAQAAEPDVFLVTTACSRGAPAVGPLRWRLHASHGSRGRCIFVFTPPSQLTLDTRGTNFCMLKMFTL